MSSIGPKTSFPNLLWKGETSPGKAVTNWPGEEERELALSLYRGKSQVKGAGDSAKEGGRGFI